MYATQNISLLQLFSLDEAMHNIHLVPIIYKASFFLHKNIYF